MSSVELQTRCVLAEMTETHQTEYVEAVTLGITKGTKFPITIADIKL